MIRRNRSSGFTLTELLIASALGTLVVLLAMTILYSNTQSYVGMSSRMDSEQTLLRAESVLKRVARQGLLVRRYNEPPGGTFANQPEGWIRPFNLATATPASLSAGNVFQWGMFQREAGVIASGAGSASTIKPTGLFYIPPTTTGGIEREGVLFIDMDTTGTGAATDTVGPSYGANNIYVGKLSNLVVDGASFVEGQVNGQPAGTNRILSIDVEVTVRDFSIQTPAINRCYRDLASCKAANSKTDIGHDKKTVFTIMFRDNDFGPNPASPTVEVRSLESIYFFQDYGRGNYAWY